MKIKSITIREPLNYGVNKDKFTADICLAGGSSYPADIKISIPEEMLLPIVKIIESAVVESMARSAEEFAEAVRVSQLPAPVEHEQLEAPAPAPVTPYDDEPF